MIDKSLDIIKKVNKKNLIIRIVVFIVCLFIATLSYNIFLVPNKIVMGGTTGLAIIVNHFFGLSIPLFLNITTILLFIISYFMLDLKKTLITFLGGMSWSFMMAFTAPIALRLNIHFQSTFLMILVASTIYGVTFGIIYRTGWNTGGSDAILTIMKEYLKIPMGLAGIWFNVFIVVLGLITFGPTKTVYAIFILLLHNVITDNVTLGVKDSKMCFVKSKKKAKIETYLIKNRFLGVTEIESRGGIFTKNQTILLVIVPADEYYGFKHLIKRIDKESFILTTDCYAVKGGYKKQYIPF